MRRTKRISVDLIVEGEKIPLFFPRLEKVMNRIGKLVVKNARKILASQNKVVSGNLSNSLYYSIEGSDESIELTFEGGAAYWDFVEQGVQGAGPFTAPKNPSGKATLPYKNRAPDSPFKFGSGKKQPTQGTLRGGIDRWVIQKPVGTTRDSKGRFTPRKQLVSAISRSVYRYGIAPSNYYTQSLDQGYRKSKNRIAKAIGLDVSEFVEENMTGVFNITISI
tara:strand:- start:1471 stop:2133 length:663 start_codon:yes stop_codon:yes gene_type:complete